ncbi:MAG TPA: ABC transporter ATP-binding protein [Tenuifilaceae bacterium]|nr:ABC transporter ATP-binding protein [Tenuifilaceae bacterium]
MEKISVNSISKSYGNVEALKEISFNVDEGELFGLIGPDGAGKTTLMRIITTLLLPDSGNAKVCGYNVANEYKKVRTLLGYMPGRFSLYQDLSVEENLNFFAGVFGTTVQENYDLIKNIYYKLEPFKKRRAGKLSGGMKQKLALSCALVHKPEVLVLDEPTTGVDAVSRKEFWDLLKELKMQGITIIVSTAYMDEASLCDRIALIQNGKILGVNTPTGIINAFPYKLFSIECEKPTHALENIRSLSICKNAYLFGNSLHFVSNNEENSPEIIAKTLEESGVKVDSVNEVSPEIEDCFIERMQRQ